MKQTSTPPAQKLAQELEATQTNWSMFTALVAKVKNTERREALLSLCEDLRPRLQVCPASTQTKYVGAYMGGLVAMSLKIAKHMNTMNKSGVYGTDTIMTDNLIVVALMAQLGKLGLENDDLYVPKDSQWHNDRGIMFEYNDDVTGSVGSRSLFWLSKYGVKLSHNEIEAIMSLDSMEHPRTSHQLYNVSALTLCFQHAYQTMCARATGEASVLDAQI